MAMSKSNSSKCIAYTRFRTPCPEDRELNSKWCPKHEELQGKCMRIYKHHSRELDRYAVDNPYPGFQNPLPVPHFDDIEDPQPLTHTTNQMIPRRGDVNKIDDPDCLRTWHHIARRTWALANRTVLAREHHHSQFYQNGDDSHRHFNAILRRKQDLLENLMSEIDQRLYRLTIGVEKADWLLLTKSVNRNRFTTGDDDDSESKENTSSCNGSITYEDVECEEEPSLPEPLPTPPSSPPPCVECQYVSEDLDQKLIRKKRAVVGRLINYLDFGLEDAEFSVAVRQELREVIRNIFRRIIVRDAGLFVRAKEFNPTPGSLLTSWLGDGVNNWRTALYECPIKAFINGEKLSLKELERLWGLMKFGKDKIGPELIRNAIADIYRCAQDTCVNNDIQTAYQSHRKSTKIWVLGGYVWRKAKDGPLPRTGSDLLHAFVGCAGCMLSTCRTFEEWAENRRLAVVGHRYPGWSEPHEPPAERLLRCFKIVICRHNCNSKLSKVEKVVPKSKKLRTVYTETQERHYLYLCMSVADSRSPRILDALHALPTYLNVYARRRDTNEVTHQPNHADDLWCSRIRSGYTTMERKQKKFTLATAFRADDNLFEKNLTSPEKSFGHCFQDCWDVLVMNGKVGNFEGFMNLIANVVLEVAGYRTVEEAMKGEGEKDAGMSQGFKSVIKSPLNETSIDGDSRFLKQFSVCENSLGADKDAHVLAHLPFLRTMLREPVRSDDEFKGDSWI